MKKHNRIIAGIGVFVCIILLSCSTNELSQATLSPGPTMVPSIISPSLESKASPTLFFTAVSEGIILKNNLDSLEAGEYIACYSRDPDLNTTNLDVFNIETDRKYQGLVLNNISGGILSSDKKLITDIGGNVYVIDLVAGGTNTFLLPSDTYAYRYSPVKNQLVALGAKSIFTLVLTENSWKEVSIIRDDIPDLNELGKIDWSPDGRWLAISIDAYKGLESGKEGIYVIETSCFSDPNSCSTQMDKVTGSLANILTWTPENNLAVVNWAENNGSNIDVYDVKSMTKLKSYALNPSDGTVNFVEWSPDSKWIALQQDGVTGITLLSIDEKVKKTIQDCDTGISWVAIP